MNVKNQLFLSALLAHLPMMFGYCRIMWNKGHYQFFPLLMGVVGWLLYDRLSSKEAMTTDKRSQFVAVVLLVADLILLATASVMYSSVLVMPALMLFLAAFLVDRYGLVGFKKVLPIWFLLLFITPPPGNLDVTLITKMQFLASQLASWILDALGQIHFRQGVVLITEKSQFFTEEACSGIRSLFSSLAAVTIYGIVRNYPIWRFLFNLVQTIIWVVVGNAIRVALVVYLADHGFPAIVTGTSHEMLGLAMFLLIFLLALSTDRALDAFVPASRSESDLHPDTSARTGTNVRPAFSWTLGGLLIVMFTVVFLFSARLTYVKNVDSFLRARISDSELIPSQPTDLPGSIEGWSRVNFSHEVRDETALLAPESFIWTFAKGSRSFSVSFDSPYDGFHDLSICYNGMGWTGRSKHEYTKDAQGNVTGLSSFAMQKPDRKGIVIYSGFDRNGKLLLPPSQFDWQTRTSNAVYNIKQVFGLPNTDAEYRYVLPGNLLPVSQIQLIYENDGELNTEVQSELRRIFEIVRQQLLQSSRFAQSDS